MKAFQKCLLNNFICIELETCPLRSDSFMLADALCVAIESALKCSEIFSSVTQLSKPITNGHIYNILLHFYYVHNYDKRCCPGTEYSRDFVRQNSTVTRRQCDGHLGTSADAPAAAAAPAAGGQDVEVDLSTEIIKQHFQVSSTWSGRG